MLIRKICMLGNFCVGKTSLVRRYIHQQFDEQYQTTLGVKIDTKILQVDGTEIKFVIWDIQGSDDVTLKYQNYLRGAEGFLVVADGTRKKSFATAVKIYETLEMEWQAPPVVTLINKSDLTDQWQITEDEISRFNALKVPLIETSALTGEGVEEGFSALAKLMIQPT